MSIQSAMLLLVIGLAIGLLVTIQFRTPPQRITNSLAPFLAVEQTRAALKQENTSLKEQLKNLRVEIQSLQSTVKTRQDTTKAMVESLEQLKQAAGLTTLIGEGVVITLDDSRKAEATVDSIVHAADLRDLVNVLWRAQSTAISLNDERLVATSSIDSIHNAVLVNNGRLGPPFVIKAVGDPNKIESLLARAPDLADLINRAKNLGLIYNIEKVKEVTINEFSGTFSITNAKIKD